MQRRPWKPLLKREKWPTHRLSSEPALRFAIGRATRGHIVTARPTVAGFGSTNSVEDPSVNNIGGHIGIVPASRAFYGIPYAPPRWYVIDHKF